MPNWVNELASIGALLAVVVVVVGRLPKVNLGHSPAFLRRRATNWLPVGLTYAFLYMARYNLNAAVGDGPEHLFDKQQYGTISAFGTFTYGLSFVINGPLTDKLGGKRTIVLSAVGSAVSNLATAALVWAAMDGAMVPPDKRASLVGPLSALYAANMYFQSFGAVSIVKVNSAWFHRRERGTFGGIFGILISLGLYFAYDWGGIIKRSAPLPYLFIVPALILLVFAALDVWLVADTPGQAGQEDFDLDDATQTSGEKLPMSKVALMMLKNPAIITIALIEFCSGALRTGILQWYKPFTNDLGRKGDFVAAHWGALNCAAGILGGIVAGVLSDRLFQSRRGPMAGVLYGAMIIGCVAMFVALPTPWIGWVVVLMSLAVIGVHGMLSGTASMDFGGKENVGLVVGVIDGFVYLGITLGFVMGRLLPKAPESRDPSAWWTWPVGMLPLAVIGFFLSLRVWNATPKPGGGH